MATRQVKRHFLQQAHKHNPAKHATIGQLMSEKLDGMRCFWDGGVSRRINTLDIPWANTTKDKKTIYATGLWSRYGKVIHAPDWWLDKLPLFPLDGELHSGRGQFQQTMSFARKHIPVDSEWQQLKLCVFDSPTLKHIFYDSTINQGSYKKEFYGIHDWIKDDYLWLHRPVDQTYEQTYNFLKRNVQPHNNLLLVPQQIVSSKVELDDFIASVANLGGEGVILRNPLATYSATRNHDITKIKPYLDDEAIVTGYITGRWTDKGSKLLGMMGALILDYNGHRLELSGFTEAERQLGSCHTGLFDKDAYLWACNNPETSCVDWVTNKRFPRGSKVTFRYRELSDTGVPKEARYLRPYGE